MGGLLKQYLWVIDLLSIFLSAFFGAKLTSVYLGQLITDDQAKAKPPAEVSPIETAAVTKPPMSDYKIIGERNIFDSTDLPPEEAPPDASMTAVPTGEAVRTSLGIKVVGVLVVGAGIDERSSATITGGSGGDVDTYSVGTENGFAPNTKLTKVKPDRIEFVHSGRLEYALIEEEGVDNIFGPPPSTTMASAEPPAAPKEPGQAIKKTGENKFVIDQKEVQNALTNVDQLYTEIRAVPNFAGGKVSGMKILSVKQGSIFDKLGLQRGDILEKINGMELDVKRGFEIFSQLKDEKRLSLDLIRQGSNQSFEYEIR